MKQTIHLSLMEDLAYRRLLDFYYDKEMPIPTDIPLVSRRLRMGSDVIESVLKEFFHLTDRGWVNNRCESEIAQYNSYLHKQKANGIKGGRPKKPTANPPLTQAEPKITLNNNHKPLTNNHINKGSRLPNDWIAPQDYIDFCITERPDLNANSIAEQFKDYWISQAGSKGVKADWLATWRNWVRRQEAQKSKFKNKSDIVSDVQFDEWLHGDNKAIENG